MDQHDHEKYQHHDRPGIYHHLGDCDKGRVEQYVKDRDGKEGHDQPEGAVDGFFLVSIMSDEAVATGPPQLINHLYRYDADHFLSSYMARISHIQNKTSFGKVLLESSPD